MKYFKNSKLLSGPNRFQVRPSYLYSLGMGIPLNFAAKGFQNVRSVPRFNQTIKALYSFLLKKKIFDFLCYIFWSKR